MKQLDKKAAKQAGEQRGQPLPDRAAASDSLIAMDSPDDSRYEGANQPGEKVPRDPLGSKPYVKVDNPDDLEFE
ncbi:hypothetical protein LLE49_04935 [Alicyclobacillus tolerans]|uniref:hypothetical protein n=1 Tax=Alicyclobacillus tolerans TaxID=90970 RepID=UPI001F22E442|nr:hypothetical protein [Alicyclobacillus tolerans]MCF8564083.1 hypothetical protein [Alicyclobacillus tolerans]